jgi:hypothetical protein
MVSKERYAASSKTGLYVLMNEFRTCCSIDLLAAASKSSQSCGSRSIIFIGRLNTCPPTPFYTLGNHRNRFVGQIGNLRGRLSIGPVSADVQSARRDIILPHKLQNSPATDIRLVTLARGQAPIKIGPSPAPSTGGEAMRALAVPGLYLAVLLGTRLLSATQFMGSVRGADQWIPGATVYRHSGWRKSSGIHRRYRPLHLGPAVRRLEYSGRDVRIYACAGPSHHRQPTGHPALDSGNAAHWPARPPRSTASGRPRGRATQRSTHWATRRAESRARNQGFRMPR